MNESTDPSYIADFIPPPNPIPINHRTLMIFMKFGQIDVVDRAFVLIDKNGVRTHIPVGSVACIMLVEKRKVFVLSETITIL